MKLIIKGDKISNQTSFDIIDFKEFLSYFKRRFCKTITELSASGEQSLIIDDFELIAFDDIKNSLKEEILRHRERCSDLCPRYNKHNGIFEGCNCKELSNASADALHVVFPEKNDNVSFYFIEFKRMDITVPNVTGGSEKKALDNLLHDINYCCDIEDLERLGMHGETIINSKKCFHKLLSHNIKLKAFESFYSILPHMYEEYCE